MEMMVSINNSMGPLYKALSEAIKHQILSGKLQPGQAVPSVRELATNYGTSRATILRCYEVLASQGYLTTTPKSGTRVSANIPSVSASINFNAQAARDSGPSIDFSDLANRINSNDDHHKWWHTVGERKASEKFTPVITWKKCLTRAINLSQDTLGGSSCFGYEPLRKILVDYLARSRSLHTTTEQVLVINSIESGLDLVSRLLVTEGDTIVMDEFTDPFVQNVFTAHGATVMRGESDEEGLSLERLATMPKPKLLYLCPSHQAATGRVVSLKRRKELLAWAFQNEILVVEDDDAREFRFGQKALPTMHSMSRTDSVIYVSSFTRVLGDLADLGFLVLPHELMTSFQNLKTLLNQSTPTVEQIALEKLLSSGGLELHLHKTRLHYERLRNLFMDTLRARLHDFVKVERIGTGTTLFLRFSNLFEGGDIDYAIKMSNVPIAFAGDCFDGTFKETDYIANFSLTSEDELCNQIDIFAKELLASRYDQISFEPNCLDQKRDHGFIRRTIPIETHQSAHLASTHPPSIPL